MSHLQQLQKLMKQAGTPDAVSWRKRDAEARRRAVVDREQRYPTLSAANAAEAVEYQETRIQFWHEELAREADQG